MWPACSWLRGRLAGWRADLADPGRGGPRPGGRVGRRAATPRGPGAGRRRGARPRPRRGRRGPQRRACRRRRRNLSLTSSSVLASLARARAAPAAPPTRAIIVCRASICCGFILSFLPEARGLRLVEFQHRPTLQPGRGSFGQGQNSTLDGAATQSGGRADGPAGGRPRRRRARPRGRRWPGQLSSFFHLKKRPRRPEWLGKGREKVRRFGPSICVEAALCTGLSWLSQLLSPYTFSEWPKGDDYETALPCTCILRATLYCRMFL